MNKTLGIIGVGHLATYVVDGLRHSGDKRAIILSPRNHERAQQLQQRHGARIARDNQDVVDQADIIMLATRPAHAVAALQSVSLGPEQLVISVVAGMPLATLAPLAKPATLVRSIPICSAEVSAGAVPLYPDEPRAQDLLAHLGQVVPLANETQFEQASVPACVQGWFYRLFGDLSIWLSDTGLDPEQARILMLQAARGSAELALQRPDLDLHQLADNIANPGTFTRLGQDLLDERGALTAWTDACDRLLSKLSDTKT